MNGTNHKAVSRLPSRCLTTTNTGLQLAELTMRMATEIWFAPASRLKVICNNIKKKAPVRNGGSFFMGNGMETEDRSPKSEDRSRKTKDRKRKNGKYDLRTTIADF